MKDWNGRNQVNNQASIAFFLAQIWSSVPPWVEWKVDDEFLKKLNHWSQEHSDASVSSVLKSIREKLDVVGATLGADGFKDLLKLIPDVPFPAGTLVRCLVNVLMLGIVSDW